MAKAKAKAKEKQKSNAGYEEVALSKIPSTKPPSDKDFELLPGAFPDKWEPKKAGDVIIGMLVACKAVDFSTSKKEDWRRIGTFQTQDGENFTYWDCAALRTLFDYGKELLGTWVRLVYKGERKIKGQRQLMKDIEVALDKHGTEVLKKLLNDVSF